jgi:hypothetical protein
MGRKITVACRCAQELREFGPDPELDSTPARRTADGDVPTTSDRGRPAAREQDLPWRGETAAERGSRQMSGCRKRRCPSTDVAVGRVG